MSLKGFGVSCGALTSLNKIILILLHHNNRKIIPITKRFTKNRDSMANNNKKKTQMKTIGYDGNCFMFKLIRLFLLKV